ncbi:MAG: serine protease, partial [Paracoccaceae bacterium]|nr:serine protease [Paracoccaceae bacterium]
SFDGSFVEDVRDLVNQVGESPVGKLVEVEVIRDGRLVTLDVSLGRREEAEGSFEPEPEAEEEAEEMVTTAEIFGITLLEMTDAFREGAGVPESAKGLFVSEVDEVSEAFEKGLRPGALIEKAGSVSIDTIAEFEMQIAEAKDAGRKSILLLVRSGGSPRFVALSVED